MAITLTGANGLFTRLGKLFGANKTIRTWANTTLPAADQDVIGVYSAADMEWITSLLGGQDDDRADLRAMWDKRRGAAARTLIEQVWAGTTTERKAEREALEALIRYMEGTGDDVDAATVSATPSLTGITNGTIGVVTSVLNDDGATVENARAETIRVECVTERGRGTRIGGEEWAVNGELAVANMDRRWPQGSGLRGRLRTCSAAVAASAADGQNRLVNSDFESWTSNVPDRWTLGTGSAGTHLLQNTGEFMRGTKSAKLVGDGATLMDLYQTLESNSGSPGKVPTARVAFISVWLRSTGGNVPATGVMRFGIEDGAGSDIGSTRWTVDFSAVTLTTSWVHKSGAFVLPLTRSGTYELHVDFTTALPNTKVVLMDELTFATFPVLHPSAPRIQPVAGEADPTIDDFFEVAITNNRAAGGPGEMGLEMDRHFDLYRKDLLLPTDTGGAETVLDSLIS